MAVTDVTMPELSEGMESGTIIAWLVEDGAGVTSGDELLEVETDKATMTVDAEATGVLQIVVAVNQRVNVGDVIANISNDVNGVEAVMSTEATRKDAPPAASSSPAGPIAVEAKTLSTAARTVRASPVAQRMAREHDVDLDALSGTGPGGRIIRVDVEQAAGFPVSAPTRTAGAPTAGAPGAAASRSPTASKSESSDQTVTAKGAVCIEELTPVQTVVARRMAQSKSTAPEFIIGVDVDMEEAIALRTKLERLSGEEKPPSFNDFIVKASALALVDFPRANGAYVDGHFELYERINVGVAVARNDALIVPTIFDADRKSVGRIGRESRRLSAGVRDGTVTPPELAGGTFTVSNLGMFEISEFISILNPPQAAILSAGEIKRTPVAWEDEVTLRHVMKLRLTCDHRILYGADAASFLRRIMELLQNPLAMSL